MGTLPQKLQDLIEMLASFPDDERINILIDYGEKLAAVPEDVAVKPYPVENKVSYCESDAYVWSRRMPDKSLKFYFAVENPQGLSAKALSAILDKTLSGESPQDIVNIDDSLLPMIFGGGLSTRKQMGLAGIIMKVKREAEKYLD
jgi:sulfur transfer protein SufE